MTKFSLKDFRQTTGPRVGKNKTFISYGICTSKEHGKPTERRAVSITLSGGALKQLNWLRGDKVDLDWQIDGSAVRMTITRSSNGMVTLCGTKSKTGRSCTAICKTTWSPEMRLPLVMQRTEVTKLTFDVENQSVSFDLPSSETLV